MAHRRVDFDFAEACLAHKVGSAVSQRYNRETLLELRRPIMEMWASFLAGDEFAEGDSDPGGVIAVQPAGDLWGERTVADWMTKSRQWMSQDLTTRSCPRQVVLRSD